MVPGPRSGAALRRRLAAALPRAMKDRDRPAVAALRSTLAVLANAEAVPPVPGPVRPTVGIGTADVDRRELTDLEVHGLVLAEAEDREQAAMTYAAAGDQGRADRFRAEAEVIRAFLD